MNRRFNDERCTEVFETLGYYRDFGDADGCIRINSGKVSGPKAFFFAPLDDDEFLEANALMGFLIEHGVDADAVLDAVRAITARS